MPILSCGRQHETFHLGRFGQVQHNSQRAGLWRAMAHIGDQARLTQVRHKTVIQRRSHQVDDHAVGILQGKQLVFSAVGEVENGAGLVRIGPDTQLVHLGSLAVK